MKVAKNSIVISTAKTNGEGFMISPLIVIPSQRVGYFIRKTPYFLQMRVQSTERSIIKNFISRKDKFYLSTITMISLLFNYNKNG